MFYFSKKNRIGRMVAKYSNIAQLCRERDAHLRERGLSYIGDNEWYALHYRGICLSLKLNKLAGIGQWSSPDMLDKS